MVLLNCNVTQGMNMTPIELKRRSRRETDEVRRRPWIAFSPAMIWGMLSMLVGLTVYFISDWFLLIYALPLLIFGTVAVVRGLMGKEED